MFHKSVSLDNSVLLQVMVRHYFTVVSLFYNCKKVCKSSAITFLCYYTSQYPVSVRHATGKLEMAFAIFFSTLNRHG